MLWFIGYTILARVVFPVNLFFTGLGIRRKGCRFLPSRRLGR